VNILHQEVTALSAPEQWRNAYFVIWDHWKCVANSGICYCWLQMTEQTGTRRMAWLKKTGFLIQTNRDIPGGQMPMINKNK